LFPAVQPPELETDQVRVTSETCPSRGDPVGDNQMNQKDEDIAHPGMVSKPEKTPNFGPIQ